MKSLRSCHFDKEAGKRLRRLSQTALGTVIINQTPILPTQSNQEAHRRFNQQEKFIADKIDMVKTENKLTTTDTRCPQQQGHMQHSIADRDWRQSMRPRQDAISLHNAAHMTQDKAVSPSVARTTPKEATIHITTWKAYGAAQRTCHALWRDLEKKGGTFEQKLIDRIFRHIMKLEEALLDAK